MKHTNKITEFWNKINQLLDEGKYEEADRQLDLGIVYLSKQSLDEGVKEIDGVKVDLWKERFFLY